MTLMEKANLIFSTSEITLLIFFTNEITLFEICMLLHQLFRQSLGKCEKCISYMYIPLIL